METLLQYLIIIIFTLIAAVYVMVTIERLRVYDWWRYSLYILALGAAAAASFGVLHSQTQRIGIVCAVVVLSGRALAGRAKALRHQGGETL